MSTTDFRKQAVLLLALAGLPASLLLLYLNVQRELWTLVAVNALAVAVLAGVGFYLVRGGRLAVAGTYVLLVTVAWVLLATYLLGLQAVFWIYIFPWLAYMFFGPRTGAVINVLLALVFAASLSLVHNAGNGDSFIYVTIVLSYGFVAIMAYLYEQARERAERMLEELSTIDTLTGAFNRRKFDEVLQLETQRAARYRLPLSVILFDVDHFKRINDDLGHHTGDQVLRELGEFVKSHIRASDYLFRYGGEEFLVMCPVTGDGPASELAEKLRLGVEAHEFSRAGRITISAGVASLREGDTDDALLKRADDGLYSAKSEGRNRTVALSDGAPA
jgi:diguanylate cyclase (GGDEF)-like protein